MAEVFSGLGTNHNGQPTRQYWITVNNPQLAVKDPRLFALLKELLGEQ
jgi:hypothetical protein